MSILLRIACLVTFLSLQAEEPRPEAPEAPAEESATGLEHFWDRFDQVLFALEQGLPRWQVMGDLTVLPEVDTDPAGGRVGMATTGGRLLHLAHLDDRSGLLVGVSAHTLQIDSDLASLPEQCAGLGIEVLGWHKLNDRWSVAWLVRPGLASDTEEIGDDAWRLLLGGAAIWRPEPRWVVVLGMVASANTNWFSILPLVAALWRPAESWQIHLSPIAAGARWRRSGAWSLDFGGGLELAEYQLTEDDPNGEALFYRDARLYLGTTWAPSAKGELSLRIGPVFAREFTWYEDGDSVATLELEPGLHLGISGSLRW